MNRQGAKCAKQEKQMYYGQRLTSCTDGNLKRRFVRS